ncbi:twin-arginine translocase TatA/TatE family subunit [Methanosarcinaceae archaeon]|nr:twin-arginine translocase TatA/TatE family subunit [Methanosarcinaceae archaeon]MBQ3621017.1 twin-arginine translocase TatA/TatE family subunit [Methanosarcinaceae archaeon]
MFGLGQTEIILIVLVIVLLFGAAKLPELARSVGKSSGEFKKAQKQAEREYREFEKSLDEEESAEQETKIQKMAKEQGIDIKGKTDEQLLDEINAKLKS